jgi:Skp family chaperone for outer membrane proteins
MKKLMSLIILIFGIILGYLFFNLTTFKKNVYAKDSIAYLRLQYALTSHPNAKKAFQILKSFKEEREKDLQDKLKNKKKLSSEETKKIQELAQRYEQEIAKKDNELTAQLLGDIQKSAEEIAKEKGYGIVLDSQVVVYGGVDITKEVINYLKEKFKKVNKKEK